MAALCQQIKKLKQIGVLYHIISKLIYCRVKKIEKIQKMGILFKVFSLLKGLVLLILVC
jgi:hypothetical protein